jgi:hypothetical protein
VRTALSLSVIGVVVSEMYVSTEGLQSPAGQRPCPWRHQPRTGYHSPAISRVTAAKRCPLGTREVFERQSGAPV